MSKMKFSENRMVIVVFSLIYFMSILFGVIVSNMDIIWNYGFSAKIELGLIPYRDFDVLITPFSFYIMAVFLKIFGNHLIVYSVVGSLFTILMYYVFYKILLTIIKDKKLSMQLLLIASIYTIQNFMIYTYNSFYILLVLLVLLIELNDRVSLKSNLAIGVLLALIFLTKQSVGLVTLFMSLASILISRKEADKKIRIISLRLLSVLLIVGGYILYLYLNSALYAFVDHTILGVRDFSSQNTNVSLTGIAFVMIPVILIAKGAHTVYTQKNWTMDNELFIILTYAIATLSMVYPIVDVLHVSTGALISFLIIPFVLKIRVNKFSILLLAPFIALLVVAINTVRDDRFVKIDKSESSTYQNLFIDKSWFHVMNQLKSYILKNKDNEIVFIDTSAMAYLFYLDIYDNKYDLPIRGNVGLNGEEKMLNRIKLMGSDTLFFMAPEDNSQSMTSLKEYVACYYDHIDTVHVFFVYKKPSEPREKPNCHYP